MTRDLLLPLDALRRRSDVVREVDLEVNLDDLAVGGVDVTDGRVALSLAVEVRGSEVAVTGRLGGRLDRRVSTLPRLRVGSPRP